jgi:hypothetical protein
MQVVLRGNSDLCWLLSITVNHVLQNSVGVTVGEWVKVQQHTDLGLSTILLSQFHLITNCMIAILDILTNELLFSFQPIKF